MDHAHMNTLWHIFDRALSHTVKSVEDESPHTAEEWMSIASMAECIIHKHEDMEYDHPQAARAR